MKALEKKLRRETHAAIPHYKRKAADMASSSTLTRATQNLKLAASLMTVLGHEWVRVTSISLANWLQSFVG